MPNWCSTTFRFHGAEEEITTLNNKIAEWTSKDFVKTDFGSSWLGNILVGAGLEDRIDASDSDQTLRCRGTLTDVGSVECFNNDYTFDLWTETAWVPMAKMWSAVIEALGLTTVGFSFVAEECGCEIYWICDPKNYGDFSEDQVYIDAFGDNDVEELNGYYTEEDALRELNKFFNTRFTELSEFDELCQNYEDEHEDSFIAVHVFERDDELRD